MTFNLTSQDGWLDPSSLRLHFRIRNTVAAAGGAADAALAANNLLGLMPVSGCHCFFSQLRILIGGTEVESHNLISGGSKGIGPLRLNLN